MTLPIDATMNEAGGETDREAEAMKAKLRKDVAAWSATLAEPAVVVPASKPPVARPKQVKKAKPAAVEAASIAGGKKPFSMSYDGISTAQHIQDMITRGAR